MNLWMKKVREIARVVLTLPISPKAFSAEVGSLRLLGLLPAKRRESSGLVRQILVCHPYSSVGDTVLLLPLLERIREGWPEAAIDIVIGGNACDLIEGVEGIRYKFLCVPHRFRMPILGDYLRLLRHLLLFREEIAHFEYDLAIAPRWGSIMTTDAVYFAYLTGAPERIGYSSSVDGGYPAVDGLLTRAASGGWHEHESVRNVRLLSAVGLREEREDDREVVRNTIPAIQNLARSIRSLTIKDSSGSRIPFGNSDYFIVSPGATAAFRTMPIDFLARVMRGIHSRTGLKGYILGGSRDAVLCGELASATSFFSISLAGQTSLQELSSILAQTKLFLGMDSGTAHVAGALGVPTLVLSPFPSNCNLDHPNSPARFRPCGPLVRVLQPTHALPPCFPVCAFPRPHCILQISSEEVISLALDLIGKGFELPMGCRDEVP